MSGDALEDASRALSGSALRAEMREGRGRCLVAQRRIRKGEVVLEEDAFAPRHLTSREQEELDERRSAGAMMAGRVVDELEGRRAAAMKPGDYAVQVHVIECRDLKAEDLNGLSDPYARVRVHGRQRKTRVVKKVTSCVFDDVLHFSLPNLTTAAAEAAAVDIAILDHDAIGRHATIGSASRSTLGRAHRPHARTQSETGRTFGQNVQK